MLASEERINKMIESMNERLKPKEKTAEDKFLSERFELMLAIGLCGVLGCGILLALGAVVLVWRFALDW